MKNMHTVFVYGTLKQGHGNHMLLKDAEYIGPAKTVTSKYTMYHLGGFPGVKEGGTDTITGEVYKVNDYILTQLHRLEGHPTFYKAMNKEVKIINQTLNNYVTAFMYIYQGDNTNNIKTGGTW